MLGSEWENVPPGLGDSESFSKVHLVKVVSARSVHTVPGSTRHISETAALAPVVADGAFPVDDQGNHGPPFLLPSPSPLPPSPLPLFPFLAIPLSLPSSLYSSLPPSLLPRLSGRCRDGAWALGSGFLWDSCLNVYLSPIALRRSGLLPTSWGALPFAGWWLSQLLLLQGHSAKRAGERSVTDP